MERPWLMRRIWRDPLVHFLIGGALLFAGFQIIATEDDVVLPPDTIAVTRPLLLEFIQYRTKVFDPVIAAQQLDGMGAKERDDLIQSYVREEALYREAQALGLEQNDYVIKQRMVQSVNFIIEQTQSPVPPDADGDALQAYFEAHQDDYRTLPAATFTHVFVSFRGRSRHEAMGQANALLEQLRADGATFTDAPRYGERFVYHLNYVERDVEKVVSHFGRDFANALFALDPDPKAWRGPIESQHGLHLVTMIDKTPGGLPSLDDIRPRVRADYRAYQTALRRQRVIDDIVATYVVDVDLTLPKQNASVEP